MLAADEAEVLEALCSVPSEYSKDFQLDTLTVLTVGL